jgi:hypothetical protein
MSLPASLPAAILDTILGHLALLFLSGAGGDMDVACHAAARMLAAYQPETEHELHLAAQVISLSLHTLEALGQAATPDMPLTKILRLRGSAVSLSRESHKAQRRLDDLRTARDAGAPADPDTAALEPTPPEIDKAIALIESTRPIITQATASVPPVWSKSYQQREAARRITENLKKNQAAHAATMAAPAPPV